MDKIKTNIDNVLKTLDEIMNMFYVGNDSEGYIKLNETLITMLMLIEYIEKSDKLEEVDINKIENILKDCVEALEEKDTVLLADIIQYDLIDALKEIQNIYV